MELRPEQVSILVGRKRCGKTTLALTLAKATGKRLIVINTDPHPAYADFPVITVDQLRTFTGDKCVVNCLDEEEAGTIGEVLNTKQSHFVAVFEDGQKYINNNVQKGILRLIINHRMRNADLIFIYHFLKVVPPKIAGNYDILCLFFTSDGQVNLNDRYGNWATINKRRERINKLGSKDVHYHEYILDYE